MITVGNIKLLSALATAGLVLAATPAAAAPQKQKSPYTESTPTFSEMMASAKGGSKKSQTVCCSTGSSSTSTSSGGSTSSTSSGGSSSSTSTGGSSTSSSTGGSSSSSSSSSGGSSTSSSTGGSTGSTGGTPVPAPAGLAIFALGAATLVARRKKRA